MPPTPAPDPTASPLSSHGRQALAHLERALKQARRVLGELHAGSWMQQGEPATEETLVAHAEAVAGAADQLLRAAVQEEVYKECEHGNAAFAPGRHWTFDYEQGAWLAPSRRVTRVVTHEQGHIGYRWHYTVQLGTIGPDGEPETRQGTERYAFDALVSADVEEALTRPAVCKAIRDAVASAVVEGGRISWDDFLSTVPIPVYAEKAVQAALHRALIEGLVLPALRAPVPGEPLRFVDPDDRIQLIDVEEAHGRVSATIVVTPAGS